MSSQPPPNPITNDFNEANWQVKSSSSNARNAINTQITATDANGTFYPTFVSDTSGFKPQLVDSGLSYNPSTNTLTATTFSGTAINAQNTGISISSANSNYYPTFVSSFSGNLPQLVDGNMTYNPALNTLTVSNLTVDSTLTATIPLATNSNNVNVTTTGVNIDFFPTFVSNSGYVSPSVDLDLKYNPSTNTLTAGKLSGALLPNYNPSAIISGQIGSQQTPIFISPLSLSANVAKTIATYTLPIGIWFIQANIQTPTGLTYQSLSISSVTDTIQVESFSNILTDNFQQFALNISRVVVITVEPIAPNYYIVARAGNNRTLINAHSQCFRIA